jgi:hypothetical protein
LQISHPGPELIGRCLPRDIPSVDCRAQTKWPSHTLFLVLLSFNRVRDYIGSEGIDGKDHTIMFQGFESALLIDTKCDWTLCFCDDGVSKGQDRLFIYWRGL